MSIKVEIKAFQSLEDVSLEIEGFTIITGPNNEGKSSVVRAIKGAFSNYTGYQHSWVRHGFDALSVRLRFDDGGSLLWERGPAFSRYEVNDKCIENAGQYVPEELEVFNVRPIKIGSDVKLWPQIADQFNQIFLMKESGAILAEAIADTEKVGRINNALRSAESDKRAAFSKLKIRRKDLEEIKEEIIKYAPLADIKIHFKEIHSLRETLIKDESGMNTLSTLKDKIQTQSAIYYKYNNFKPVDFPEEISRDALQLIINKTHRLQEKKKQIKVVKGSISLLESLTPPKLDGSNTIKDDFKKYNNLIQLKTKIAKCEKDRETLLSLKEPDEISDLFLKKIRKIVSVVTNLKKLKENIDLAKSSQIEMLSLSRKEKKKLQELNNKIKELEIQLKKCPTCGKELHDD